MHGKIVIVESYGVFMLKKFKEENKRKKQIIIFTCACVFLVAGILVYQSFALFETNEQFNVVSGTMENPGDITFAFYINDEIVLEAPKKDSGFALDEKSSCTNGVSVSWNEDSWNAKLDYSNYNQENTSNVKCNLYFRDALFSDYVTSCGQNNTSASECMIKYAGVDTVNLAYDETTDNNLRYIGSNPNNYVWFNDELWRIIGVMENVDDGTGKKETRIKLIRDESIGNYSWDSSARELWGGIGINEWTLSKVKKILNEGGYWNRGIDACYIDRFAVSTSCDFRESGLLADSKALINDSLWYIGANDGVEFINNEINTFDFYMLERSNFDGSDCLGNTPCNDSVTRATRWVGKVGLIHPSDYGFATGGGTTKSRMECLQAKQSEWNIYKECYQNNWMHKQVGDFAIWAMNPSKYTGEITNRVYYVWRSGINNVAHPYGAHAIYPVVYLKSSIKITDGIGTKEKPYLLSKN